MSEGSFFGELYLRSTLPFLNEEVTRLEVDYLAQVFSTVKGPILDVGCGHGRHAASLQGRIGSPLFGIDLDVTSLAIAAKAFPAARADFFRLPLADGSLAGAYAWYSTLFTFEDDAIRVLLRELVRCLRPDGLLVFHTAPRDRAAAQPEAHFDGQLPDGCHLTERCTFNPLTSRDESTRVLTTPEGRTLTASFFIRYFLLTDLTLLLAQAGLAPAWIHGGLDSSALDERSLDLIVGARRA